jgi:hypothetical protein
MANETRGKILTSIKATFGALRRLPASNSMFVLGDEAARIYFRYSKVLARGKAFFGLRQVDLRQLEATTRSSPCLQTTNHRESSFHIPALKASSISAIVRGLR